MYSKQVMEKKLLTQQQLVKLAGVDRAQPMMVKLTVLEAATILGVTAQFLRMGLRQGRFSEFGTAVKFRRWAYYINSERFYTYVNSTGGNPPCLKKR